jgi:RNA polymerase sigma factor for flagellar operon FliA
LEDLTSAGIEGLIKAIEKFNPRKGAKFETYSPRRIEGEILDSIRRGDWVPRLVRQRAQQIQKATAKLQALYGRIPTAKELADEFMMDEKEFSRFQRDAQALNLISLDSALSEDDRDREFQEIRLITNPKSQNPYQEAVKKDLKGYALKGFQREEKLIIYLYYYEEMTMKEIGKTLGISESRVSQIHTSIIERLQSRKEEHALLRYLLAEGVAHPPNFGPLTMLGFPCK